MIGGKGVKNFLSLFSKKSNVSMDDLQPLLSMSDAVSGIELLLNRSDSTTILITPPHARTNEKSKSSRELPIEDMEFYEGCLHKPFIFPLFQNIDSTIIQDFYDISKRLVGNEQVYIQWLFKKEEGWQDTALEMYESYLDGNDYPSNYRIGRLFQDHILRTIDKISLFDSERKYNNDIEEKILSEGVRFQLRIGFTSDNPLKLKKQFENTLNNYAFYNAFRLFKVGRKAIIDPIYECEMSAGSSFQILSLGEIRSLFDNSISNSTQSPTTPCDKPLLKTTSDNIIELLPKNKTNKLTSRNEFSVDFAQALKRVGLIKTARVFNETLVTGVRFNIAQFDIPKDKTITQIQKKKKDIAAVLGMRSIEIEQGDLPDTVKISTPHDLPSIISLREIIERDDFHSYSENNPLSFAVGVDEIGNPLYLSLQKLVHLLVAGTTGSGKSVFINSMALTLMMTHSPKELEIYMIDPKEVELQQFSQFPHVHKVETDMDNASAMLRGLVEEMNRRYSEFQSKGVKSIDLYNKKTSETMPYIVCIIDEYADLKATNEEVEQYISRLGQKARASGIHLVLATQRPSADIISGNIKSVIPSAISFNLSNNTNYKTVFGTGIPYSNLLGRGDGVMKIAGHSKEFQRFQSVIISPNEEKEEEILFNVSKRLANSYSVKKSNIEHPPSEEENKPVDKREIDNDLLLLNNLKTIIANTKETRLAPLRDLLGVKTSTMTKLMLRLVEEGWLIKHKSNSKGYEIVVDDQELKKWEN